MKNRIIIFSSILLVLFSPVSFAQISRSTATEQIIYLKRESFMASSADTYRDVKGTPYLYDTFVEGSIYTLGGDIFPGEYRYDIFANRVQFMNNGVLFQIAYPDSVAKVVIGESTLKFVEYTDGKESGKGFMLLLEEGKFSLLEKKNKDYYEAMPARPYQEATPARFGNARSDIYMKSGVNPAVKITGAKDIIKMCGDRGNEVKNYISKEKINTKDIDDLRRLVKYLNS